MLLFRSEEGIRRWCDERNREPGAVLTLEQTWALSRAWYGNRLHPEFRGRNAVEAEAVFRSVGLTGAFWSF